MDQDQEQGVSGLVWIPCGSHQSPDQTGPWITESYTNNGFKWHMWIDGTL